MLRKGSRNMVNSNLSDLLRARMVRSSSREKKEQGGVYGTAMRQTMRAREYADSATGGTRPAVARAPARAQPPTVQISPEVATPHQRAPGTGENKRIVPHGSSCGTTTREPFLKLQNRRNSHFMLNLQARCRKSMVPPAETKGSMRPPGSPRRAARSPWLPAWSSRILAPVSFL